MHVFEFAFVCLDLSIVCVFSFGQSRSLFGVGPSIVSIEIGEASLISSLKKEQIMGLRELLPRSDYS